jgi:rhamnogalacturonan endolyase
MNTLKATIGLMVMFLLFACSGAEKNVMVVEPDGFVLIKGNDFGSGKEAVKVADFEIMDHPVTNMEYKLFVDATQYPYPLHWKNGKIPEGKDDYPVIFVNREDVDTYIKWLASTGERVYRLPTAYEFELAAKGGKVNNDRYYWGNDESRLNLEEINFNINRGREFDRWDDYLKPARWGMKNNAGLYQMAGNVWHLIEQHQDPALSGYKYRIEKPVDNERAIIGGGWCSTKEYLVSGKSFAQSPGIRYPDLGFRLVRNPECVQWEVVNRQVCASTSSSGKIGISWAMLDIDNTHTRYNIYRITGDYCSHNGTKINAKPINSTSYSDEGVTSGKRYQYRVIPVDNSGKEGNPSEWTGITAGESPYPVIAKFKPLFEEGDMAPVFGNLEGYGKLNCVIRLDNGCKETSQDPGKPVQLEAFSYTGKSLWRIDVAGHKNIFGSASNAPFNVWDMDGDGRDEVITLLQVGKENFVAILDGMSGDVLYKAPWVKMATDVSRSSTRIQMSIAYLDGKNPAIITQTGIYENEIVTAYDHQLNKLWDYKSFMETNGSGGHKVEVADVDGDGKQEIVYGTTCLNPDGTMRWSIYRQHPDIISIHDYIPNRPGLEVCFIVESSAHAGIYMVDANSGEIVWKNNREDDPLWSHGHTGWTADIWDGSPGMECMTNRMGHHDRTYLLFSAEGKKITGGFPVGYTPLEWDGDPTRELIGENGMVVGKFDGEKIVMIPGECPNPVPGSKIEVVADLCGDFRSELVISATDTDGRKAIMVVTAPSAVDKKYLSPRQTLDYRLWLARNKGGGYGSVFEYELKAKP